MEAKTYNFTKGDCYAVCEFLNELTKSYSGCVAKIADTLQVEPSKTLALLDYINVAFDRTIASQQDANQSDDIAWLTNTRAKDFLHQVILLAWCESKIHNDFDKAENGILEYLKIKH